MKVEDFRTDRWAMIALGIARGEHPKLSDLASAFKHERHIPPEMHHYLQKYLAGSINRRGRKNKISGPFGYANLIAQVDDLRAFYEHEKVDSPYEKALEGVRRRYSFATRARVKSLYDKGYRQLLTMRATCAGK